MKRTPILLCGLLLFSLFAGCGALGSKDYAGTTLTGQVTAINGTTVTLALGQLTQPDMPTPPEDGTTPSDMPTPPQDSGSENSAPPAMLANGTENGQTPPEKPAGEDDAGAPSGTPPEMENGRAPEGTVGTGGATFTASGETAEVDLAGLFTESISTGGILTITFGEDGTIVSLVTNGAPTK